MLHGIALLLPCRNEAPTIGEVVHDVRATLLGAEVYIYTAPQPTIRMPGRRHHPLRAGPGEAMSFGGYSPDVYVIADGDGTYDAVSVRQMIDTL